MTLKPLKKITGTQQNMTEYQFNFFKNMADPVLYISGMSAQIRSNALERKKLLFAQQPHLDILNEFLDQLRQDDESSAQFNRQRLPLADFDDEQYATRELDSWLQQARYVLINDNKVKALYATVFDGKEWISSYIIGTTKQSKKLVYVADNQQKQTAPFYCFIWGEDIDLYKKRLEAALYMRNQTESQQRLKNYIFNMPSDCNSQYPPNLRGEIKQSSVPRFQAHQILSFSADQYSINKNVTLQIHEQLLDTASQRFLQTQNRIIFEQMMEKSPSVIAERQLQLARDQIINTKLNLFYNQQKSDNIYRHLITPSTLMSFIPPNCQFDDYGNPICDIQQLQLNVGIYLAKKYNDTQLQLEKTFLNEENIIKYQNTFNEQLQQIIQVRIRQQCLEKNSLAKHYDRELLFDEKDYQQLFYFIIQKNTQPQMAVQSKVYSLEEFKQLQNSHQQNLKNYLEYSWMDTIRQIIQKQFSTPNREFTLTATTFEDYDKQLKLKKFIRKINQQIQDVLISLIQNSYQMYDQMVEFCSQWQVECKSPCKVTSKHADNISEGQNASELLTIYRQPLFQIFITQQEEEATMEEKQLIEKQQNSYIFNMPSLFVNERVVLDDEDVNDENDDKDQFLLNDDLVDEDFGQTQPDTLFDKKAQKLKQELNQNKEQIASGILAKQFTYLTNPNEFVKTALEVLQNGNNCVSQIQQIEHFVLKLPFTDKQYIKCELNDMFEQTRQHVESNMRKLIAPLSDYLLTFNKYRELLFLDEEKYLSTVLYRAEMHLTGSSVPKNFDVPSDMQKVIDQYDPLSPKDLKIEVGKHQKQVYELQFDIPEQMHVGCFVVQNREIRKYLEDKCDRLAEGVQNIIMQIAQKKAQQIINLYNAICRKLTKKPKDIEGCCKQTDFITQKIDKLKQELLGNIRTMNEYYTTLDELLVFQQNSQTRWKILEFPSDLDAVVKKSQLVIENQRNVYRNEQTNEQEQMIKQQEAVSKQTQSFAHQFQRLEDYEEAYGQSKQILAKLQDLQDKAQRFNKRENLLNLSKTDYSQLEQLAKDFEPQALLWQSIYQFNDIDYHVNEDDFKRVNASQIVDKIDQCYKDVARVIRNLKENQAASRELAEGVKIKINEFKKQSDLLLSLRNPNMRRRHWLQLSKLIGQDMRHLRYINGYEVPSKYGQVDDEPSDHKYTADEITQINQGDVNYRFTIAKNQDNLGEEKTLAQIKAISSQATSQYMIEKTIDELEQTWSSVNFDLIEYGTTGQYILRGLDDVIQKLDDSITMIQSMSFAPFKEFFASAISKWETSLTQSSEIIEIWIQVQQAWLYLEPIFASADIARQLPSESKIFRNVDQQWKTHMQKTYKNRNVINICSTKDLLKNLTNNRDELEKVQKGLADYLETKRIAFPRFFFLADEELLQILSNTKDPTAVQKFLKSCFENVNSVLFVGDDYQMVQMESHEEEKVKFVEPLVPAGQVEHWMGQLEKLIIRTVKYETKRVLVKHLEMVVRDGIRGRANWVRSGFAQGILLVNQLVFANDTEWAINGGYLKQYLAQLDKQLSMMTELVREGLNKQESKCFSALLTYDVFQRDQVEGLINSKVTQVTDFEWLKHPKHYCNLDEFYLQPTRGAKDNYYDSAQTPEQYQLSIQQAIQKADQIEDNKFQISFQQILSTLPYAFEYLGNTPRLVITPLTLKIYSTISQSQAMFKFTACSGPAGSGKTETSKQMANKEFGQVCIVFNCSEGLDLIGIKRMLSGVISSGGCLVMDEINRLSLDVLSVFAQMVLGVQFGLSECKGSVVQPPANQYGKGMAHIQRNSYLFEGTKLELQSTASVIITQNPNYSGRQKLPANLVALFRAVSVMVPNYMKICQIRLYSFGFKKATSLAQKAVSVFKLCSEQLSQCSWYDYGMRAINSTIQAAGNIRQLLGVKCAQQPSEVPTVKDASGQDIPDQTWYTEDQIVLRAITEVNLPKFLENDALLFNNILKDLFPGIKQPYIDYNVLKDELRQVLRSTTMNYLQPEEAYVDKIIDLYMTINLRHGLMTLGNAASGKTEAIYSLMHTLNRLNELETEQRLAKFKELLKQNPNDPISVAEIGIPEEYTWQSMAIQRLDPKSITMDQLFGQFDPISKEWNDGILSTLVRNAAADADKYKANVTQHLYQDGYKYGDEVKLNSVKPEIYVKKSNYTRQIVLHDGYIDSLWIESLNTVMDDSKRLCLTSGEIIKLTPYMNMLFSMDSVAEASPATISRNGMLYFTNLGITSVGSDDLNAGQIIITGTLTPQAYIQSWIDRLPDQLRLDEYKLNDTVKMKQEFKTKHNTNEKLSVLALVFKELINQFVVESIAFINVKCQKLQEVMDANIFISMFRIMDTFMREIKPNEFGNIEIWQIDTFRHYQEAVFFFSLIWSVGAVLANDKSKIMFDGWLRKRMVELTYLYDNPIPDNINGRKATVFDFMLKYDSYDSIKEKITQQIEYVVNYSWIPWGDQQLQNLNLDNIVLQGNLDQGVMSRINLGDVIIPTPSNIQQQYLIRRLLLNGFPTLVVGQTGSGKTAVIKNYLMREDTKIQIPLLMTFSANTQAGHVQEFLDGKLEKRRRGIYGPPVGKKYMFYVDDLNLPMKERYGCINSHELVRQMIAHNGWYDLKELTFRSVIDTNTISSMCPVGGSRNPVTQRLLRHFNVINFLDMNESQLKKIFQQVIEWWGNKQFDFNIVKDINPKLTSACKKLVEMGINIYDKVRTEMLPTPSKEHYTFNMRDLSKLFQGFMMIEPKNIYFDQKATTAANQPTFYEPETCVGNLIKLFIHEVQRVFGDRLINQQDRNQLLSVTDEQVFKNFSFRIKDLLGATKPEDLIYGDFVAPTGAKNAYQNIQDGQQLQAKLINTMNNCNEEVGNMNLVLFNAAIQHLSRIVRILRQDGSNLLLIGVGGVGRQSLTRLAAYHLDYQVRQIEISKNYGIPEWRATIKNILLDSGLKGKQQVFLLSDQHIFNDKQLEDISILLNTCDLQSIYEPQDMLTISDKFTPICKQKFQDNFTKQNVYDTYLQYVKQNIHIVLCFSPSGSTLRNRLRKFPSLVNCCSIDYVSNWPREAMVSVGKQIYGFTGNKDLAGFDATQLDFMEEFLVDQCKINNWQIDTIKDAIIEYTVDAYETIEKYSVIYKQEQGRFNHVTPTLLLNSLKLLYDVIQTTYVQNNKYKQQLSQGLDTMKQTQLQVKNLQDDLTRKQPELVKLQESVSVMMIELEKDKKEAEQTKQVVTKEKVITAQKVQEVEAIKADADRELAQVQPLLDEAVKVLNKLEKNDFQEVAQYQSPPVAVKMVLEAICILMKKSPKKVPDKDKPGVFNEDFWDESKKLMNNYVQLKQDLEKYDKEGMTIDMVNKLKKYMDLPYFNQEEMQKKSKAAAGLCAFANAMYQFYFVNLNVIPKRQKQAEAQREFDVVNTSLKETEARLDNINQRIASLEQKFNETLNQKEQVANQVEECAKKLERAQSLIISLGGEQARWTDQQKEINQNMKNALGNALYGTVCVIYQGAFNSEFRSRVSQEFYKLLMKNQLIFTEENNVQLTNILSNQVTLMDYVNTYKLPSDMHSMQNATILFNSKKYCLLIDPEQQGFQFLKNYYSTQGLEVIKANDPEISRTISNSIRFGKVLIITGVEKEIDPSLTNIIEQKFERENKTSGPLGINFDGNFVPLAPTFKLFLCTHLSNPNYQPEQFVRLTVVNFAITQQGLQDQLLGQLFAKEQREQEEQKIQLVTNSSRMKVQLKKLEEDVLRDIGSTDASTILDNETLIESLNMSQKTAQEVKERVKESEITEANIDKIRKEYIPMARRASILYFCVQDMMKIDFMYQYSLQWYINLYNQSIDITEQNSDRLQRIKLLIDTFTLFLFQTICRSLFDEHKLLFALLMAIRIALSQDKFTIQEFKFLLIQTAIPNQQHNPCSQWLSDKSFQQLYQLEQTSSAFSSIIASLSDVADQVQWKALFESNKPEEMPFPEKFENCTAFQRFLPIVCFRPDRVIAYARKYIQQELGEPFIQTQILNIGQSFKESNNMQPLLFILGDMADPVNDLMLFAEQQRMRNRTKVLSLGRGVEKQALNMIAEAQQGAGQWVVLQNCHLCVKFLKMLEQSLEQLNTDPGQCARDFRLWITSQPTTEFPVTILQNAVKISVENPNDLKANMLRVYQNNISEEQLQNGCKFEENRFRYKKMVYAVVVFYASLLQRKRYGSIGFNTPYPWSAADVGLCVQQLPQFLDRYRREYPHEALKYLFAGINIGGCVTDAIDQRTVDALSEDYLAEFATQDSWLFQQQKIKNDDLDTHELYQLKGELQYNDYLEHIMNKIPIECHPNNLGLNTNSNITSDRNECSNLLSSLLSIQAGKLDDPKAKSSQQAQKVESDDFKLVEAIQQKLPKPFDIDAVLLKYPTVFEESLNSLLVQECGRFNALLEVMRTATAELLRALQGQTIMSEELEHVLNAILLNKIPEEFAKYSYPSLKPLNSYLLDLQLRVNFFANWINNGKPKIYNISAFFFAQGFLTSVLQNFARKYETAIDTIQFNFQLTEAVLADAEYVARGNKYDEALVTPLNAGAKSVFDDFGDTTYITGLYLEAARLNSLRMKLSEALPRELFYKMPIIRFTPVVQGAEQIQDKSNPELYECPSYRTTARFGTLSTTGHSTNFLLMVYLPCESGEARHWIKRSVAMFASLSD